MKITILVDDHSRRGGVEVYAYLLKSFLDKFEFAREVEILSAKNLLICEYYSTDLLLVQHISPCYFEKVLAIDAKYKVWCFHNDPAALILDSLSEKMWPLNNLYAFYSARVLRSLYCQIRKNFDHIVFQHSDFEKKFLQILRCPKVAIDTSIIPNFQKFDSNLTVKNWEDREYDILVIGRLEKHQKRVDLIPEILKNTDSGKIAIVGAGSMRDWLKNELQGPQFAFFDWTDCPASFYENSKVLLLTSQYEGYGMVLDEALQHGCLPVCFDIGGPIDRFSHLGMLKVRFGDLKSMSKLLSGLLKDKDEVRRLVALSSKVDIHAHNEYVTQCWRQLLESR